MYNFSEPEYLKFELKKMMNELVSFKILFKIKFNINNKIKKNEKSKKKEVTRLMFKNFTGWVINIKIISLPSLPPIIFNLNNNSEGKNVIKKKKLPKYNNHKIIRKKQELKYI